MAGRSTSARPAAKAKSGGNTRSAAKRAGASARASATASSSDDGPGITDLITLQWKQERADLDLDNFLLAIYVMRLGTWLDRAYDRMCQERWGIGGGDMRVLLALRRGGAPYVKRPTDLFRALLVTSGAITKKVDRLAEAGYVERLPDPAHNGGFLVHLTRKGLNAVESATEKLAKESMLAPAMERFTAAERKTLSSYVQRILKTLESVDGGDPPA